MEAKVRERVASSSGVRKALLWCLAVLLSVQLIGVGGVQAVAAEIGEQLSAANESLGKNLVYDDVYGVKHGGYALMWNEDNSQGMVTDWVLVDSTGEVMTSFGMDDIADDSLSDKEKTSYIDAAWYRMDVLFGASGIDLFPVPAFLNGELLYGLSTYDGNRIADAEYTKVTVSGYSSGDKPLVAGIDRSYAVDIYDGAGKAIASLAAPELPAEWTGISSASIYPGALVDGKRVLYLSLYGENADEETTPNDTITYRWVEGDDAFTSEYELESVSYSKTWLSTDGLSKVTMTKEGWIYRFETPEGSFSIDLSDEQTSYEIDVFVDEGVIQFGNGDRAWNLKGDEIGYFSGLRIKDRVESGVLLCCNSVIVNGVKEWTLRNAEGEQIGDALPEPSSSGAISGQYYTAGGIVAASSSDDDGMLVYYNAKAEEINRIECDTGERGIAFIDESEIDGFVVCGIYVDGSMNYRMIAAYNSEKGEWLSALDAVDYYYAEPVTLPNGSAAYRIPVFAEKTTTVSRFGSFYDISEPLYYACVDKGLNTVSDWLFPYYSFRSIHGSFMYFNQPQRTLADGTVMTYVLNADGKLGAVDAEDNVLIPFEYEAYYDCGDDPSLILLKTSEGWQFFDVSAIGADEPDNPDNPDDPQPVPATAVAVKGEPADSLGIGDTVQLTADVQPADTTDVVSWASDDETVLTVDEAGLVRAVGSGTAKITATAGEVTDSVTITVSTSAESVSLSASELTLFKGGSSSQLIATVLPSTAADKSVVWASSDESVATVDAEGNVVPVDFGNAIVTATTTDGGFAASCSVTVAAHVEGVSLNTSSVELVGAQETQLVATVHPEEAYDKTVAWETSDSAVATVDETGKVSAAGKGTALITAATSDGSQKASCEVTVLNPVAKVEPSARSLALVKGGSAKVEITVSGELPGEVDIFAEDFVVEGEGSFHQGVWSNADGSEVFSVEKDDSGEGICYVVTALGTGSGTIRFSAASDGATAYTTVPVTVTNPAQSVVLSEEAVQKTVGDGSFELAVTVDPVDADGAGNVKWTSSDESVATVDDGVVTLHKAGSATIAAQVGDVTASCALTVGAKEIASTGSESSYQGGVIATDSATANKLEEIVQENGDLVLVVQAAQELTEAEQSAIASLETGKTKVADVIDVFFRGEKGEVSVDLSDDGLSMTVRVVMTDAMKALDPATLKVSYVSEDGSLEPKPTWVEGDVLCFTTEHFSTYVITGDERQATQGEVQGGNVTGSANDGGQTAEKPVLAATGDSSAMAVLALCSFAAVAVSVIALSHIGRCRR